MAHLYVINAENITVGRSGECSISCAGCEELSSLHLTVSYNLLSDLSVLPMSSQSRPVSLPSPQSEEVSQSSSSVSAVSAQTAAAHPVLYMNGRNGGYINGRFVRCRDSHALNYGDEIVIPGLRLLWLGEMIAVSGMEYEVSEGITCYVNRKESENNPDSNNRNDHVSRPAFKKSPRMHYASEENTIELLAPPVKQESDEPDIMLSILPAFTMALPMLAGFMVSRLAAGNSSAMSGAFMYTGIVTAIVSAALGVVLAGVNIKNRNKKLIISEEKRKKAYLEYVAESEALIKECYKRSRAGAALTYPEVSEYFIKRRGAGCSSHYDYDRYLLWNRNISDDDFLSVRLGTGNIPYELRITLPRTGITVTDDELRTLPARLKNKYSVLKDVPVTTDFTANKITGVVTEDALSDELFLTIIMQLAVNVSPEDVCFTLVFTGEAVSSKCVNAVTFLPHIRRVGTGNMQGAHGTLVHDEIRSHELADSRAGGEQRLAGNDADKRTKILFTDSPDTAMEHYRMSDDVCVIVFARQFGHLPSECSVIIQKSSGFSGIINLSKYNPVRRSIHFDSICSEDADRYSRVLAAINVKPPDRRFILPDKISFYELYSEKITKEYILLAHENNSTEASIEALLGIDETGKPLILDLSEKGMGPHGLIAGMTGSGKSEILSTIILSLALRYSPEDVGFFIIDYKGGGMSEQFEGLPHIMGSISNLSGRLIYRAMASVKSENEKRQMMLRDARVNNISDYRRLYKRGAVSVPLPHIFIIIDEFAELKREEPDFMQELISVARVGRSLGIHLILATQKPSGSVDNNILSNSRYRICLKVRDKSDSSELIGSYDAAFINNPGRAYLQVGNNELFVKFQGAITTEDAGISKRAGSVILYDNMGKIINRSNSNGNRSLKGVSQLREVTENIRHVYEENPCDGAGAGHDETGEGRCIKAGRSAGISRIRKLWHEPLPDCIDFESAHLVDSYVNCRAPFCATECMTADTSEEISDSSYVNLRERGEDAYSIPVGLYDNPARQSRGELNINVVKSGSHIIIGSLSSGKSTLLSTIAYAYISGLPPDMLNMYFVDLSRGALMPFADASVAGGYISDDNTEDTEKLFIMLEDTIAERKTVLRGGNFRQYITTGQMPALIVVIDNLGAFRELTKYEYDKRLMNIIKDGESLGIYVIAGALNISSSEVPRRMFECFGVCLTLQLRDRYEYRDALGGSDNTVLPDAVRGRGLCIADNEIAEFQAYRPVKCDDDFEGNEILCKHITEINAVRLRQYGEDYLIKAVRKIPVIPENPTLSVFKDELAKRVISEDFDTSKYIPIGYKTDSGKIFGIPYMDKPVIISGRPGSGKKNLMRVIREMAEPDSIVITNPGSMNSHMRIYVYDENLPISELNEIKKAAGADPYVIHLGGALDRQNIADFSYIQYSKQIQTLQAGYATVRKTADGYDYGEIIIPKC